MMLSRYGVFFAAGLLAATSWARAEQVIISDTFGGTNAAPLENRWPDTANVPGTTWEMIGFDKEGTFAATLMTPPGDAKPAPSFVLFNCAGNSSGMITQPISNLGPYVKPTQLTISADLGSPNGGASPLLGFYSIFPAKTKRTDVERAFTGIELICNASDGSDNGTLVLFQNGKKATSVKHTGAFDPKVLHHLSYDVDTATGAISNVSLQGSTSDYSAFKSTEFTDAATAFVAVAVISSIRDAQANIDNFQLTTKQSGTVAPNNAPPAAPTGLAAIKGRQGWNSVQLDWSKSLGAYSIFRGTTPGGEAATPVANNVTTSTFTDTGLVDGNTYYYKVKATNPFGSSESNEASYKLENPMYRDKTEYPPFSFNWSVDTDLTQVRSVYPHLFLQRRAFVATEAGLLFTDDDGHTWTNLPEGAVDKVGPICDIAFHPIQADTFYIASKTKGVWLTTDNGKTFKQIGAKAKGMASDTIVSFIIYPGDASHLSLLAAHGDSATGFSRSRDGGQTWDVVNTEYHFTRVFGGYGNISQIYAFGATAKEPDIQCVYTTHTVGEYISEVVRDVVPTDLIFAPIQWRQQGMSYLATSDSGLYRIDNNSTFGMAYDVSKLPYPGVDGWASIGVTWGPTAEALNIFLYDPTKTGLVVANKTLTNKPVESEDISQGLASSKGLPVSPLTKEGAVLRPNANGSVCYAVANNALSIGRLPADVPVVNFNPGAFQMSQNDEKKWRDLGEALNKFASDKAHTVDAAKTLLQNTGDLEALYRSCQIAVTAQVPIQPSPPASVTIDLSRYGGLPDMPLYDDGRHNDGAANDGVYGTTFAFLPWHYGPRGDDPEWRCDGPGLIAMGVVATYADGRKRGAVGTVNYLEQIFDQDFWHDGIGSVTSDVEGDVKVAPFLNPLAPGQPSYAPRRHKGDVAVRVTTPKGPWTVHFKMPYNRHSIDSYAGLSFYLRVENGEAPKELYMKLLDEPEFSPPTTTDRVEVLHGMTLTGDYQRISLPIGQVLGPGSSLQTDHLSEIIISGESTGPSTLVFDGLAAIATYPPPPPPPEPTQ